jgi:hypothetical protein
MLVENRKCAVKAPITLLVDVVDMPASNVYSKSHQERLRLLVKLD